MIYDNLKRHEQVNSIPQIIEDTTNYERFFQVQKGDIVVDIGAHVGMFTKNHIGKASKIFAIEPDPLFFKELAKLESDSVYVYPRAIDSHCGTAYINSDGNANSISREDLGQNANVTTVTFKYFIENAGIEKIDFLKIDCEGGEYDIFTEDNMDWLSKNCKHMAGEFHIHNNEHRAKLPLVLFYFEKYGIPYKLTSIDGVILSKEMVLNKLDYYKEIMFYASKEVAHKNIININYVDGCFVELLDWPDTKYDIEFINKDTKEVLFRDTIGSNCWSKCNFDYFINWRIVIAHAGEIIKVIDLNLKDKRVYIALTSKSLGDTLAWFPYVEEFRKKHGCTVVCSTFLNDLFRDTYPEIIFVEPGTVVHNLAAQYNIGWFYNGETINRFKQPIDPKIQEMQKTASDILGLEYKEIKPILNLPKVEQTDSVTLGIHSTAQAKYWNNPTGWQDVVDYLKSKDYTPILLSREEDGYMGNKHPFGIYYPDNYNINTLITEICKSKAFVGVGSGLSWLAWACNVPVILISGFSEPYTEMQDCYRIKAGEGKCSGCFNRFKLNGGDWNWCPDHKGTERQFECTKSIDSNIVINTLNQILNDKH
jgi:autotransporter strand-loop-strand O-heptosyltransferase